MSGLKITTQAIGPGLAVVSFCLLLSAPGVLLSATDAGTATENGNAPWLAVGDGRQGQIYHRAVTGSSLPEAMIVARFTAPPARVHALVTDYGHFAEFIPDVAESRVLLQTGGRQWVFHHLHFAGPVADRAYVIESTDAASRPQENYYRVDWSLSSRDFPGIEGTAGIRPRVFSGFWDLRPLQGGLATEARYAVHSDPGGFIPDWLVVKMTDRYMKQVIAAVAQRLGQTN
jgi:ribosome-associated toxin RatA of RatAB toxin-antitoxin module